VTSDETDASRFALISLTYPRAGVTDLSAADGVLLALVGLLALNNEFSNMARVAANEAIVFTPLLPPGVDSTRDGDRYSHHISPSDVMEAIAHFKCLAVGKLSEISLSKNFQRKCQICS